MSFLLNSPGFPAAGGVTGSPMFVAVDSGEASSTFATLAGLAAGDVVVFHCIDGSASGQSMSGGTALASIGLTGLSGATYWKTATSGDATAGGVVLAGTMSAWVCVAYRGPTSAARRSQGYDDTNGTFSGGSAGSPLSVPGFTKAGSSKVVFYTFLALNNETGYTPDPGLFQRSLSAHDRAYVGDLAASSYTNGTAFSWTYGTASAVHGEGFELT